MSDAKSSKELRDAVHKKLNKDAKLLNIEHHSISDADFLSTNAKAVYIPVAITERPEGRKSIYDLSPQEKTLMGIYVTDKVYSEFITRMNEDSYIISFESPAGETVYAGKGKIKVIDDRIGLGEIVFEPDEVYKAKGKGKVKKSWIGWSFWQRIFG